MSAANRERGGVQGDPRSTVSPAATCFAAGLTDEYLPQEEERYSVVNYRLNPILTTKSFISPKWHGGPDGWRERRSLFLSAGPPARYAAARHPRKHRLSFGMTEFRTEPRGANRDGRLWFRSR